MSRRDSLLAALVATIWGFNFVVIDWGMDGVPPLVFVAVRFAAVVVPAIFLVRARALRGAPWPRSGCSCRWGSSGSSTSRWTPG